jgi:carboxylesterase
MHEARLMKNTSNAGIVVFVHGFLGSPRQFDRLAEAAYSKGYSTLSLLLPGHGSSLKIFSNTTMESWTNHVNTEIGRLSSTYDRIIIVGHSLGGLLAINASKEYSKFVQGLFLIYCPFRLGYLNLNTIKVKFIQVFFRKSNPIKAAYLASCSVQLSPSLIWRFIKPTLELRTLISITIGNLHSIHIPLTAIYSSSDEVVSPHSLAVLKSGASNISVKSILLTNSLHAYFTKPEQAIIEHALLDAI